MDLCRVGKRVLINTEAITNDKNIFKDLGKDIKTDLKEQFRGLYITNGRILDFVHETVLKVFSTKIVNSNTS